MGKTKVVLSYIHYPMAIGRYIHRAFARRDDIELVTVGPYTGAEIPWKGRTIVPEKYINPPTVIAGDPNINGMPIGYLERMMQQGGVEDWDLLIQIDANFHFSGRPSKGTHFIVGTDPHCVNYDSQRKQADVFFNMQRVYAVPGDRYLPYAYDVEAHRPPTTEEEQYKHWDLVLCGLMYDQRRAVIDILQRRGRKVFFDTGPIFDEALALYHSSRVGFNWSSRRDLNARVFELMAMGVPSVINYVPDIHNFFETGIHYMGFDGAHDGANVAANMIELLLEEPEAARTMAAAAREAVEPHTWDDRVGQIMDVYYG